MKRLFFLSSFIFIAAFTGTQTVEYDYVIKNGRIVDGTGNPWYRADIGIQGEKIKKIGLIAEDMGKIVIDAGGRVVAPGFIDIHAHPGYDLISDRTAQNFIMQGATTLIGGNCGQGPLKLTNYFENLEKDGIAVNIGMLVGHNSIRFEVMKNAGREPTEGELEKMKAMVERAMKEGALGLSTGLKYLPGVYSKTDEVIELAKVASEYGGFYASHLRDEGLKLFESIAEAIEIGEKALIPVQISHHKTAGVDMWGKTTISLKMMEDARKRGIEVTTDQHPYRATFTGITILFPAWSLEGRRADVMKRFEDSETKKKIIDGIIFNIRHDRGGNDIKNVTIAEYPADRSFEGKNLHEVLRERGEEPTMENAAELLIEMHTKGGASAFYRCLSEEDVVRIMQHPLTMHAADAGIVEYKKGVTHPRHYGHFPRILARHVREKGDLRLEDAIKKMTSLPARKVGAFDRGIISIDKYADLVIFNPETIRDKATWSDPHQYPVGIDYVIVNGEIVVDHGKITGKLPGKVMYGPGKE